MQSFQERFKNKSNIIGKSGEIDAKLNQTVVKPAQSQIHSFIIKNSAKTIIESQNRILFEVAPTIKSPSSASPESKRKINSPKRQVSQAPPMSFMSSLEGSSANKAKKNEFTPYTITDYSFIRVNKYYQLGGLGASTIGTDD